MFPKRNALLAAGLATLAAAAAFGAWSYSQVAPTRNWVGVDGRVIRSGSEPVHVFSRYGDGWADAPRIRYAYAADGRKLEGDQIYPGYSWHYDKPEMLRDFLRPYAPGAAVTVYYDPRDPARSVLLREGDYVTAWILFGLGLWLTGWGWLIRRSDESPRPRLRQPRRGGGSASRSRR